jgi:hypothetical protein
MAHTGKVKGVKKDHILTLSELGSVLSTRIKEESNHPSGKAMPLRMRGTVLAQLLQLYEVKRDVSTFYIIDSMLVNEQRKQQRNKPLYSQLTQR